MTTGAAVYYFMVVRPITDTDLGPPRVSQARATA